MANHLSQVLSSVGDGTGTVSGASDSSVTAVNLKVLPAAGQEYRIYSLTILIEDNAALIGDGIGAAAAISNGIRIQVLTTDSVVLKNLDAGLPIKRTADLLNLGAEMVADASGTNKFAAYTLRFPEPVILNGSTPSWLNMKFNDNLSTLVLIKAVANGISRGQPSA